MRVKLTILLLSIIATSATSWTQDAEDTLKQFEGKTMILLHPLLSGSQRYDAEGKVLKGGGNEGSWALYAGVLIDRVTLTSEKLRLEGRRIFFVFPKQKLTLLEFTQHGHHGSPPFSPSLNVEVTLDKPLDSSEQALTALSRVFALKAENFLETLPDFWREYLVNHHFSYDPFQKKEAEYRWREEVDTQGRTGQDSQPDLAKDSNDSELRERVVYPIGTGSGVKAPNPIHTPAPEFSSISQYENYQGIALVNVVVGTDGKAHRIRLLRALGMGLDEIALSTVRTWRFQPATRNGQPVAVEMNIEVAFNMF